MAKDNELDRLKATQDLAFQRKQDAYQTMQSAWERLSSARDEMNRAFDRRQSAYEEQDRTWQALTRLRDSYGPRIESLNSQQEAAFESMKRSFDSSQSAFSRRDGAAAKSYSEEGHRYKAESQGYVAERRRLVAELRSAKAEHDSTKPAFQRAKEDYSSARSKYSSAKAEQERARQDFKRAKEEFNAATTAFRTRLEKVKEENRKRNENRKDLAAKAGVPYEYRDKVWVSKKPDGTVHLYFGGLGEPDGPGHGHYVMDNRGEVTYKRDPFDPHGPQHFTDSQQDYADLIIREAPSGGDFGFWCKFRGFDAYVESNINRQGREKIDIYYGPNGPFGAGHHHAVAYRESPFDFVYDELR